MRYRIASVVLLCIGASSCAKVRDFGCLSDGYWVAAPSHVEMGVYDRHDTAVLERYVFQVGLTKGFIVASCEVRPGADAASLPGEQPCKGYNVINTATEQVWRGLSGTEAAVVLKKEGIAMPELHYANEWFNQDWPDGNPSAFCKAHFRDNPAPQP
ncbi:hypothetical protein [Luteibacter aegosomatissinici]|uniref:hypothetical protein n=1 Tax=Luteibacter aegosomatissinici TaxID=2911539 RepID=UPI001FFC019E|nr:hypothetical protein [Luteibacter aegosomatissinici]UPG96589.1 hypothetical protein L2Y97_10865 [Luteibacter aegosomatissinici]